VQKLITIELQSHFHKDIEEPFKNFLDEGWRVVQIHISSANMNESKAACWLIALMEKDEG
jgi:hypothetical protein